jgi:hypothetical protein
MTELQKLVVEICRAIDKSEVSQKEKAEAVKAVWLYVNLDSSYNVIVADGEGKE